MAGAKTEAVQISDTDWMVIKKYKNGLVEKRLVMALHSTHSIYR